MCYLRVEGDPSATPSAVSYFMFSRVLSRVFEALYLEFLNIYLLEFLQKIILNIFKVFHGFPLECFHNIISEAPS